ncbi:MAG: hypothetical protein IPL58_05740 [Betaproteobacteria bacterium]|uniref:Uncharacterized protein n=1 Tax=Candidatus Proximibacter danicus TaxID=2954365 RepID=A0A9D7K0R7_9PROT|nr:hypothetical protein [Candidatus Proximibacter danicus]MBK9445189.1 hypothetical protein [Betaproteobacteria bacterium]
MHARTAIAAETRCKSLGLACQVIEKRIAAA